MIMKRIVLFFYSCLFVFFFFSFLHCTGAGSIYPVASWPEVWYPLSQLTTVHTEGESEGGGPGGRAGGGWLYPLEFVVSPS